MEKNIGLKRKAQLSIAEGRLEEALRGWEQILGSGDADPYDFVTVGDLLLRLGRHEEARTNYEKACQVYESLGFLRNAIGVTKKILRMGGDVLAVHLKLAHLYIADGLFAEATEQAAAYVSTLPVEGEPREEAVSLLESLRDSGVRHPELALRLADFYEALGKKDEAARELRDLAETLPEEEGDQKAARLRARAQKLNPGPLDMARPPAEDEARDPAEAPRPAMMDHNSLMMEPSALMRKPTFGMTESEARESHSPEIEPHVTDVVTRDEWVDSVTHLETVLGTKGKTQGFLERLVAMHREIEDSALIVASLERLARHFEECQNHTRAVTCWEDILALNPSHSEALERAAADEHEPKVTVFDRKTPPAGTPLLDMEELLRDFQDEVSRQIPSEDGESHYALALSHYEMGLYEKALGELEIVLGVEGVDPNLELRCRELKERCVENMDRDPKAERDCSEDAA